MTGGDRRKPRGGAAAQASRAPRVTVLMPVFNGEAFLAEAVRSVLDQSLRDLELLVVDDCSTDRSVEVVRSFRDPRIRLVRNEKNLGRCLSPNKGLDLARGEYVARLDCDDVCLRDRLAVQVAFLDRNPEVGLCGSWLEVFGDRQWIQRYPASHDTIACALLFNCPLGHSSVTMRRRALDEHGLRYDPSLLAGQDYDLWRRCVRHFRVANIQRPLVRYRLHPQQLTTLKPALLEADARAVRERLLRDLGLDPTPAELACHERIASSDLRALTAEGLDEARAWLEKILAANWKAGFYAGAALGRALVRRWFRICAAAHQAGLPGARAFGRSDLARSAPVLRRIGYWLRIAARRRSAPATSP